MSPLTVRRYRAELLLRQEFKAMRGKVLGVVRGRLRASGVSLDASDLEACYAQAWQGLFEVLLEGEEIDSPPGWLVQTTFRRAIDEHRSRHRSYPTEGVGDSDGFAGGRGAGVGEGTLEHATEHDFAGELDDRIRLRQLFEGLRGRLGAREQQAAALCYLQGFSRAEAAARMGISETRMRKLMEGLGPGRPGVAGKVGELVEAIRAGSWCEQQGSLMRGYAFGILDPEGERYQLALAHQSECPACRAYIRSLRGLAVVLPAPGLMPWVLGRGAGVGAHTSSGHASSGHANTGHAGAGVGAGSGGVGAGAGVGAVGAAGAGGVAGGGWLFAGGIGTKLAVGCLVAVFSAGCIALNVAPLIPHRAVHHRHLERASGAGAPVAVSSSVADAQLVSVLSSPVARGGSSSSTRAGVSAALPAAAKASREFGPEQALASASSSSTAASSRNALNAKAASSSVSSAGSSSSGGPREFSSTAAPSSGGASATPQARSSSSGGATSSGGSAAQREFGIG
jgi:DNA-directed RNA polymerase specialized sigma24 family protein